MIIHICKPGDTTKTICGLAAGRVSAVNYSEYFRAHGQFCEKCEPEAQLQKELDKERWAREEAGG